MSYNSYTVEELTNIETGEKFYQIKNWYKSDDPYYDQNVLGGGPRIGYYKTEKEAHDAQKKLIESGVLK